MPGALREQIPNSYSGTCVKCKKMVIGRKYSYIRKDAVRVEDTEGFRMPGQHEYRITYQVSHVSSFVCEHCVRNYHSSSVAQFIFLLCGLGFSIFLIFYRFPSFPQGRFFGFFLTLFVFFYPTFISLFGILQGSDGVKVAMEVARAVSKAKGETHTILFVEDPKESVEGPR